MGQQVSARQHNIACVDEVVTEYGDVDKTGVILSPSAYASLARVPT